MRLFSFLISSIIHLSLAAAALHYSQTLKKPSKVVYVLNLIEDNEDKKIVKKVATHMISKEDLSLQKKKPIKKWETAKSKKIISVKKPMSRNKNWLVQKQPSPVAIEKAFNEEPPEVKETSTNNFENIEETKEPISADLHPSLNHPKDARLLIQKSGNKGPEYSVRDRINKKTGQVVVLGFVDNQGFVTQVKIIKSSGTKSMEENVLGAFKEYRFAENQEGWVKMPYQFSLEGEAKTLSSRQRNLYRSLNN
jgi:TonB family protein